MKKVVTGVEMFRKLLDSGEAGDNVGLLLRGTERKDVERGQVVAKPGSINPHKKFRAEVYVSDEGRGRTAHAVLPRLPAAVLLPDDGRDGIGESGRGCRDGDSGRQHEPRGGADSRPSRWSAGCGSRFVKAAGPSAPGPSPRFWSSTRLVASCWGTPPDHGRRANASISAGSSSVAMRALRYSCRPVAQLVESRSPKPVVGGSSPSWPAIFAGLESAVCSGGNA